MSTGPTFEKKVISTRNKSTSNHSEQKTVYFQNDPELQKALEQLASPFLLIPFEHERPRAFSTSQKQSQSQSLAKMAAEQNIPLKTQKSESTSGEQCNLANRRYSAGDFQENQNENTS